MNWLLRAVEQHAALTQAMTGIVGVILTLAGLLYAIRSLRALQRQTEASVALSIETFRPIVEVEGALLSAASTVKFKNKGNGAALNFRWRENSEPVKWVAYKSNIISPQEADSFVGRFDHKKGLVLSYNAVSHRDEILTVVAFGSTGTISNEHHVRIGAAETRSGWTIANPELAIPAWHPKVIRLKPWPERVAHWWRWKRGLERRLPETFD